MNMKELARIGAKAQLAILLKDVRALVRMFPGIADENAILSKKKPAKGRRKKVVWTVARRKAQSERLKALNAARKKS